MDPHGYKTVEVDQIHQILEPGTTELLLFLPASFLYRFAESALDKVWSGSEVLRKFLLDLFGNSQPTFSSVDDFIDKIRDAFRSITASNVYVDTFTLEASPQNRYALFFFTSNALGFEKMLEAKWKLDEESGRGFVLKTQLSLFGRAQLEDYPDMVKRFLRSAGQRTNEELYEFGLHHGYLPKHTSEAVRELKKHGVLIRLESLDGEPARGLYLEYKHRRRIAVSVEL